MPEWLVLGATVTIVTNGYIGEESSLNCAKGTVQAITSLGITLEWQGWWQ